MRLSEMVTFPNNLSHTYKITEQNEHNLGRFKLPYTGIEVEVENIDKEVVEGRAGAAWMVATDGSLRNGGVEFISRPLQPENVESALYHLYTNVLNKSVHFSPRTSVHAHLNCRDLTLEQIYNIVILYQCFESLLYTFAGSERRKSIFCIPLANTLYYLDLKRSINNRGMPQWSKYTGLNLNRLTDIGTIEFRHLRGTNNYHTICTWLEIIYKLYDHAINTKTKELENLIIKTRKDESYMEFLNYVFEDVSHVLPQKDNWLKEMKQDLSISKLYMSNIRPERTV